jgi:TolB-like protein/DNA-binding winged helix-turn-helix (wHTH) protein/Flp pilus assembly protein TadD
MPADKPTLRRFQFGVYELDPAAGELRKQGVRIKLQEQPLQLLQILLENAGRVVAKEDLQKRIWPSDTFVDFDHGLHSAITRLREALGDSAESPRFVETLPRRGYRFVASVKEITEPESAARSSGGAGSLKRYVGSIFAGLLGGALVLALVLGFNIGGARRWLWRTTNRPVKSLGVLPFENLSGDASQDYFADGMTDALITRLAESRDVQVISRTSMMQYKGVRKPLPEIGRELGVDAILEGTIARAGNRVRVTVQLIDAATDQHLWAKTYDGDLGDILILEADMSRAIAGEIRVKISSDYNSQLTQASRVDPELQEAYLQGRYHLNKGDEDEIYKGIGYFQQAIAKDPRDARSYAGLADSYVALSDYYLAPAELMQKAKQASSKALELDDHLAEAHTSSGVVRFLYDWDWDGAQKEFDQAIRLNPSSADAHLWYGVFLAQMGRRDPSIAETKRAEALDPLSLVVHVNAGWVYYLARQNSAAIEEWKKALDLEPRFAVSHTSIWVAYLRTPDFARLMDASPGGAPAKQDPMDLAALSGLYAVSGNIPQARIALQKLTGMSQRRYICPYEMATAHAVLGDKDEAMSLLERGFRDRSACIPDIKTDPRLDALRTDPRFIELLRKLGFPQ